MFSMGKPYPEYTVFNDAIRLTLYSVLKDEGFVRFITETQDKNMITFSLSEFMILRYLFKNKTIHLLAHDSINNETIRELCRCTKKQATTFAKKMRDEGILEMIGRSTATRYKKID